MTDHLVSPDHRLSIGGREFILSGSFATLKAVQHAFGQDIMLVQARVLDMTVVETALLLSAATGLSHDDTGQLILDELDVAGVDYQKLKAELMAWLAVAMTPRRDREKKALALKSVLEKAEAASRGPSTRNSASAASAGPRKRSGKAPSGK